MQEHFHMNGYENDKITHRLLFCSLVSEPFNFLTVMELLSCLTLCSSCSRSSFRSELHFISFCFSSSLAEAQNNTIKQLISLMNCLPLSLLMFKRRKQSSVTFFVSNVGMNNSQSTRPRDGFFFFQDLKKQAQSCHRGRDSETMQTKQI